MKTKSVLVGCAVLLAVAGVLWLLFAKTADSKINPNYLKSFDGEVIEVTFYKSTSCGCCGVHANYLKSQGGLKVNIVNMVDVSAVKQRFSIPSSLQSCHTAVIGDYFVEGHIPLEAIEKLMSEKPDILGIAMPGMPSGAPGMPGSKSSPFIIYAVNKDGSTYIFATL